MKNSNELTTQDRKKTLVELGLTGIAAMQALVAGSDYINHGMEAIADGISTLLHLLETMDTGEAMKQWVLEHGDDVKNVINNLQNEYTDTEEAN